MMYQVFFPDVSFFIYFPLPLPSEKNLFEDFWCSSVVECLPKVHKDLDSIEDRRRETITDFLAETSNCYELFESIFLIDTSLVSMPTNAM